MRGEGETLFFSKFRRSKRGVGSVVGAVFVILIILSGFVFYQIALLTMNNYNRVTDEMNQADWRRANEELTILGAHVTSSNYLDVTVKNTGSVQSVIEWIGIFDQSISPEGQQFFSANIPIPIGENRTFNSGQEGIFNATFMITPTNHEYLVQLVTKEGNIYFFTLYPASQADLALSLIAVPATVYQGNNITLFVTVTNINEDDVVANNISLDLTVEPPNLTQEVSAPATLTINSLAPGSSTFFSWTYATIIGATEDKTVIFTAALNPNGVSASASVTIKPQPTGTGGQGQVTITGTNAIQKYSPSQWTTPYESSTNPEQTYAALSVTDNNQIAFESHATGIETSITRYITSYTTYSGTVTNFAGMQSGPDGVYATFAEEESQVPHQFGNNENVTQGSRKVTADEVKGSMFNSSNLSGIIENIKFLGGSSSGKEYAKAVIYNEDGTVLATSDPTPIAKDNTEWKTLIFTGHPTIISSNTNYWLTIVSDSSFIDIYYSSTDGVGISTSDSYAEPDGITVTNPGTLNYCIYATISTTENQLNVEGQWTNVDTTMDNTRLAIYLAEQSGSENLSIEWMEGGITNSRTLITGWNNISVTPTSTFTVNFKDTTILDITSNSWSIDAALLVQTDDADRYSCEVEFTGSSNTEVWRSILWSVETSFDADDVVITIQFYDYNQNTYVTSGDGYSSFLSIAEQSNLQSQTVESNFDRFSDSSGTWKVKIVATKYTSDQFTMNVDWIELQTTYESGGNTVAYGEFQEYTIKATSATGVSASFMYASIHVNGTNITLLNADTNQPIANPAWVQLDVNGEYRIKLQSTNSETETFVILVSVGTTVGQKTVTQEAP